MQPSRFVSISFSSGYGGFLFAPALLSVIAGDPLPLGRLKVGNQRFPEFRGNAEPSLIVYRVFEST